MVGCREGKMRVGILGGTFDPVHLGHLAIADEARAAQDLSEVVMIPAGLPAIKPEEEVTPAEHRLSMLRLAVEGRPYLRVSEIEIERPGISYTVDTLAQLRKSSYEDDDLYFIIGWDSLAQLPLWHEPERMLEMCRLIAVPRPGYQRPEMNLLEARIPGIKKHTLMLDKPLVDISASEIRDMVEKGKSVGHLVPGPVAEYIAKNKLYRR
jgi:nicotinate-nucleotide adenylyltransferase